MSNTDERTYVPTDAADEVSPRPDYAIIAYTARLRDEGHEENDLSLAPWVTISANAPPTLLIRAMDDDVDDIRHPMAYALALKDAGVSVDMRIYAHGGHAFRMRPSEHPITAEWPEEVKQWLHNIGVL